MKKMFVFTLIALSFTGCVSKYVAPVSGATAKLNIKNQSNFQVAIVHYEDAKKCTGATYIPPGLNPLSSLTTTIRANVVEAFTIQPLQISGQYLLECKLSPSFIPQENNIYTATLIVKDNVCAINLVDELTKENVKNVVMREYYTPMVESQGFCKPLAE